MQISLHFVYYYLFNYLFIIQKFIIKHTKEKNEKIKEFQDLLLSPLIFIRQAKELLGFLGVLSF